MVCSLSWFSFVKKIYIWLKGLVSAEAHFPYCQVELTHEYKRLEIKTMSAD